MLVAQEEREAQRTERCASSGGSLACQVRHRFGPVDQPKTAGESTTSRELVTELSDPFLLRWPEAQAHRRPWLSLGWVRRYCRYSERASRFMSATYSSKGSSCPCNPLIGTDLMCPPGCQMSKHLSVVFTQQVTR